MGQGRATALGSGNLGCRRRNGNEHSNDEAMPRRYGGILLSLPVFSNTWKINKKANMQAVMIKPWLALPLCKMHEKNKFAKCMNQQDSTGNDKHDW